MAISEATGIDPIFISVKQAAQALNISTHACYQLVKAGAIASTRGPNGRQWLVSVESVRAYAKALLSGDGDAA